MFVFRAEIQRLCVRIANREDPDQTANLEAVWSGSAVFVYAFFGRQLVFEVFEHLLYLLELNMSHDIVYDNSGIFDLWC